MEKLETPKHTDETLLPAAMMKSYRKLLEEELDFVSRSKHMKQLVASFPDYCRSRQHLTVIGAPGTGRATLAKAIHLSSADWWRPFIEADLTGIDERRALKYLFGHKEGRIFSSGEIQPGLVSAAAMSTLCLKNFCRYPKRVQRALQKLCENSEYVPLSSKDKVPLDCRVVFTVQGEVDNLTRVGQVDTDVGKVLSKQIITLLPLSKRKEDIVPLVAKFIRDWSTEFSMPIKKISKEAEKWLKKAPWNENVMQLKKSVFTACMNTYDQMFYPHHFALAHEHNLKDYQQKQLEELSLQGLVETKLESFLSRLGKYEATHLYEAIMDRVEEPLLKLVLNYASGNQIKASRVLGINRNTLRAKINKYGIKFERKEA